MSRKVLLLVILHFAFYSEQSYCQDQYKVLALGFYNCENLFDTIHDPNKKDEDFTPTGQYHYTSDVYRAKLHNVATVFEKMGADITPDGPAIIGLAEIENGTVLADLAAQPEIINRHYKYAWFYTSDERGISTGMLYNPKYLTVIHAEPIHVPTETLKFKRPTRDILHVYGVLAGDTVHIFVNHWPSKSGGEAASAPGRKLVATINKNMTDSLLRLNPATKIIIMGDFNDNPNSEGIAEVLNTKANPEDATLTDIYNPWMNMYKKGLGTESYHNEWNLIDQIMLSGSFLKNSNNKWKYYKHEIFNRGFLVNRFGPNKGLPHRSFSMARRWDDGYSDHFPVLVYLVEKK